MRPIRVRICPALALALLIAVAGCSSGAESSDGGDAGIDGDGGGGGDLVVCQTKNDCADNEDCIGGVCQEIKSCSCNYDCGERSESMVCNTSLSRCEPGSPPTACTDFCDCAANEVCSGDGQCVPAGGDDKTCTSSDQCGQDEKCIDNRCVPKSCTTRDDCANTICLVCKNNECTKPPGMCQGDDDCCSGFHCNFGTCIPDSGGCQADDDCTDPDFPRCRDGECTPECVNDADCGGGQQCRDNECVSPGCTIETCPQGQWCNPDAGAAGVGECQDGCDQNSDCAAGKQCNYDSHICVDDCCGGCGADQYCDTSCACQTRCTGNQDCQQDWECDLDSGQCHPAGAGQEGDACTVDLDCDNSQGLLCDTCDICQNPPQTLTCLYDCAGTYQCPRSDLTCQARGFSGGSLRLLCIPQ